MEGKSFRLTWLRLGVPEDFPIGTIYKGTYPYIVGLHVCLFFFFPGISLWLPSLLMKQI